MSAAHYVRERSCQNDTKLAREEKKAEMIFLSDSEHIKRKGAFEMAVLEAETLPACCRYPIPSGEFNYLQKLNSCCLKVSDSLPVPNAKILDGHYFQGLIPCNLSGNGSVGVGDTQNALLIANTSAKKQQLVDLQIFLFYIMHE